MPAQFNMKIFFGLVVLIGCVGFQTSLLADSFNGFDVRNSRVPPDEIHQGGPPRDGIPAIDKPKFVKAARASFLQANDRVLGLHYQGESKAYPVSIMNWHEIVNDKIRHQPVVVTFCPLCGSGVAFSAYAGKRALDFGVSGLLYNSDVLLYDRQTESLWSQLLAQAVSGRLKGETLTMLPLEHTSWGDWVKRYPNTVVLSEETGYRRDYDLDPYAGYENSEGTYFPVAHRDPRYHPKEKVLGIEVGGHYKAYPFAELSKTNGVVKDVVEGESITVIYDVENHAARAVDASGDALTGITAFWFAWIAFHPETSVFTTN